MTSARWRWAMSKKSSILILGIFILILSFPLKANQKDQKWFDDLVQLTSPYAQSFIHSLSCERGPLESDEYRHLIINNINTHLSEVARLQAQGWHEVEIKAHFDTKASPTGTGSLSGLLSVKGGGPIEDYVSVSTYNEFGHYCGYDFVLPKQDRRYRITDLTPGKYFVLVRSSYYGDKYYRNTTDWRKAKLVRVNENKETRHIDFILEGFKGKGSISGRVRRKDGTPMTDCDISVYNLDFSFMKSAKTDSDGRYIVPNLTSGDYKIYCSYEESGVYMGIWYGNTNNFAEASIVTVTEPATTDNIDFILDYSGTIEGRVTNANGKHVGAYECTVTAYDGKQNYIRSAYTNNKGQFSIPGLPKGKYKLWAWYSGQENNLSCWYKNAQKFKNATFIVINPLETKNVLFKLKRGGVITGTVVDFNEEILAQSCQIYAYDENQNYVKSVQTDESGMFRIQGLASGRYKLYAEYTGFSPILGQEPASEWYDGRYSFDEAMFIKVTAPNTMTDINFSLTQGGYIAGTAVGPNGDPLGYGGSVYAYTTRLEYVGYADVDYNGRYFITGLPSGEYRLRALYFGEEDYLNEWYDNKNSSENAEIVRVTAPHMTGNIDFALDYAGIIQGFLTDKKGNRLVEEDHLIQIYVFVAATGEYADFSSNTFSGGYQIALLEDDYKIAAVSFYSNRMTENSDLAVTYHLNGIGFYDPNSFPVPAVPGSSRTLETLEMPRPNGSISGTIFDKNSGFPVTKGIYFVFAFDEDGYLVTGSGYYDFNNSISGEYRLGGLRPGNYYLLTCLFNESSYLSKIQGQWYNDINTTLDLTSFTPKMDIPLAAFAVTVDSDEIRGIDFHLNLTKKQ